MAWFDGVKTGIGWPVSVGVIAIVLGLGGFGAWASVAPLEGAVLANGTVTTLGRNKLIQHLEGGIIKQVLVREGDSVAEGQPLVILDGTSALGARNRLQAQLDALAALEARAVAERDGLDDVAFPKGLLDPAKGPEVQAAIADQRAEFLAGLQRHKAEMGILDQQIAALKEEITGIEAQQKAVGLQLQLATEGKTGLQALLDKALVAKTQVLQLRAQEADLIGQSGQLTSSIAKAKQNIAEKEQEQLRLVNARLEDAGKSLSDVRRQRADLQEQLRTAEDTLNRTTVLAPDSGTVTNLAQLGPGSVVSPGQRLLEIVPDQAELVVEAHIRPQDVDEVHVGQNARLAFSALDQRITPQIGGEVTYVSADRLENERTGEAYYLARLKISSEPVQGFDRKKVGAGQPAEVYITTGQRTFLTYVIEPIAKTVTRAIREN